MTSLRIFAVLIVGMVLTGCSTTVTNLTSSRQSRVSAGLYPFEVIFDSNQQSLQKETVKPYVIVGLEPYPMQPAPLLPNRWETLVPVPEDQSIVNYRYKFDFDYLSIPQRRSSSVLSRPYQLEIVDKPGQND